MDIEKLLKRAQAKQGAPETQKKRAEAVDRANELAAEYEAAVEEHNNAVAERIEAAKQGLPVDMDREEQAARKVAELQKKLDEARSGPATQKPRGGTNVTPPTLGSTRQTLRSALKGAVSTDTSLYRGMAKVYETGSLGLELAKQIERLQSTIDARVVKIFSIMDEAAVRVNQGDAYQYDDSIGQFKPVDNPDFSGQLKATTAAARDFASVVEVLPQEIVNLVTELEDAERAFSAVLMREPMPTPSIPPKIDPWNPVEAAKLGTNETIGHVVPELPTQPALEHGARETERVFGIASNMVDAIQELKHRVDVQTIQVLNTINEAMSRAIDGKAYAFAGDTISAVSVEPNPIKRLETTVQVAHELIEITERLPKEIQTLINEIRNAEKKFFDVLKHNV